MEYIVGIDLGTTNSCVAIWRNNDVEIIPDEYGNKTIPSYVAYTNVNRYVGIDAKNQSELNPENVFYEVKRLIGRKYDDPMVNKERRFLSYDIDESNRNIKLVSKIKNNELFTPEEIQAAILMKLKNMASTYLKTPVTKAIITIPANFNDGQRQATKDAAMIAGIDCLRFINEPTAAGLAYGLMQRSDSKEMKVIVYDFGGGTLDVTLLNIENGIFEVIASTGNMRLGGSDFDNRLMMYSISKFSKQGYIIEDVKKNLSRMSLQRLRHSCEQAKKILSTNNKTHITVQDFYDGKDLFYEITRYDYEKICYDLFLLGIKPIHDILRECNITTSDINDIIFVGGMTRTPKVKQLIKDIFDKEPNCTINPDEAIATGAAIQAYLITNQNDPFSKSIILLDVISLSLGVEVMGGIMDVLVHRNSIIPIEKQKIY